MDDLSGRVLAGRYRVEGFLGRGGMADVYKVWDEQRAAHLALKVLHDDLAEDVVFLRRFKREALLLERLQHPNIVRFYGLEESDGMAFILMDFIDGLTLRKEIYLSKSGLQPERILQLLRPVCAALYYAHQLGMVHCDIKPANVMIHRNGNVYLADFGIAHVSGSGITTNAAVGAGTPAYMALEQIQGREATPASDIYALGVVLFEMITGGERPYTGELAKNTGSTTQKIIWEKRYLPPPLPSKYREDLSPELESVVMRCLAAEPRERYTSALDLLHALESAVHAIEADGETLTLPEVIDKEAAGAVEEEVGDAVRSAEEEAPAAVAEAALPQNEPSGLPQITGLPTEQEEPLTGRKAMFPAALAAVLLFMLIGAGALLFTQRGSGGRATATPTALTAVGMAAIETTATSSPTATPPATSTATVPPPTITPTLLPTPLGGGEPGANGRIAFASDRNDVVQVWLMDPDGKNHRQVTYLDGGACQPAWSPDGQKLVYITPCDGPRIAYPNANLQIIDVKSGEITKLNIPGGGFDPAWSPDGKTIAYTAVNKVSASMEVHALNLEDNSISVLADRGTKSANPAWTPDGNAILFTCDSDGVDELWIMRKDGGSQERFTNGRLRKYFNQAAFSPDGSQVLATMKELNVNVLTLVMLDRDNPRAGETPLTKQTFTSMEDGSFSPDGKWVVFWIRSGGDDLRIVRANQAGEIVRLDESEKRDFHPAWRPN